jgi:hypothetical protein
MSVKCLLFFPALLSSQCILFYVPSSFRVSQPCRLCFISSLSYPALQPRSRFVFQYPGKVSCTSAHTHCMCFCYPDIVCCHSDYTQYMLFYDPAKVSSPCILFSPMPIMLYSCYVPIIQQCLYCYSSSL